MIDQWNGRQQIHIKGRKIAVNAALFEYQNGYPKDYDWIDQRASITGTLSHAISGHTLRISVAYFQFESHLLLQEITANRRK
jgi:hypothetical protein